MGVLLYRLVSHRYPVPASSFGQLIERHARRDAVPLCDVRSDLPPKFLAVVERALRFDPAERHRSAGHVHSSCRRARHVGVGCFSGNRAGLYRSVRRPLAAAAWSFWRWACSLPSSARAAGRGLQQLGPAAGALRARSSASVKFRALRPGRASPGSKSARITCSCSVRLAPDGVVLGRSGEGHVFPSPLRRKVARRSVVPLPGTNEGERVDWRVTSAGAGRILVLVALPQKEIEEDLETPHAAPGASIVYGTIGERTKDIFMGSHGASAGRVASGAGALTPGRGNLRALDGVCEGRRNSIVDDIWMWR
jgi:hypothetical protein